MKGELKNNKKGKVFHPKLPPIHPGEILREELLIPRNMSPQELAQALKVPKEQIQWICEERGDITPDLATRLSIYFNSTVEFWLNLQRSYDKEAEKIKNKNPTNSKKEFEQTLQELENPNYAGEGFWSLSENPTALEKSKYDICQKILNYQQKHKLTDKEIAQRINLTTGETEDILFCRIEYFTLDRLITYANELFEPLEMKITKAQEREGSPLNGRKKDKRKDLNFSV